MFKMFETVQFESIFKFIHLLKISISKSEGIVQWKIASDIAKAVLLRLDNIGFERTTGMNLPVISN